MERFDASIYQVIVHVNVNRRRSHGSKRKKENYDRLLDLFNFTFAFDLICTSVHVIHRLNKQIKATSFFVALSKSVSWSLCVCFVLAAYLSMGAVIIANFF